MDVKACRGIKSMSRGGRGGGVGGGGGGGFFFNDTATTEIYTLSLHDALPISMIIILRIVIKPRGNLKGRM